MLQNIIVLLIFIVIFCVLVVSHEGGHFLIAKANGIRVTEFTVGMGPVLYQKKKGDTMYSIRLLPVGGACIFDGMDGLEVTKPEDEDNYEDEQIKAQESRDDSEDGQISFRRANVWSRIATVVAGPFANFILGFILAMIIVSNTYWSFPTVSGFSVENSPAQEAGLKEGDVITSVNGNAVHMSAEVTLNMYLTDGEDVEITYERDGQSYSTTITPILYEDEETGVSRYVIGVYIGEYDTVSGIETFKYAGYMFNYYLTSTWKSLGLLVQGRTDKVELSGPVGMAEMVDESYESAMETGGIIDVILNMVNLAMLLSINLGLMNLLPIPALDGGRLIFLLIEVVRGKPVPEKYEGMIELVGVAALIALMVVVLFHDVSKLF
ncbi:RIP metalloprotease RseP [Butyrivibrio sp.]|uniref:RIP metalloprotease RseP n=1 Tax=Butyrivibrio sp. TaxID=28121 RepID=UPI0025DD0400|nr:RIP metalloprotease RseP [Butyrivibrio sp.]